MSDDGRYVAFASVASNLVSGDTNGAADVFVYDRVARSAERVSVSDGAGQLSLGGDDPAISGDGRHVAFVTRSAEPAGGPCEATADANGLADVYVRDRSRNATELVSYYVSGVCAETGSDLISTGNAPSVNPSMSQDGRFVAFESAAAIVAGDTNAAQDILVHDRSQDEYGVSRVSVADTGAQANGASTEPSISDDGRYVAFASDASNLDQTHDCCGVQDANAMSDIHVRDRFAGKTAWASRRPSAGTPGESFSPAISGDGKRVSFASDAALHQSGANSDTNGLRDIYQTDLAVSNGRPVPLSFDDDQGIGNAASDRPAESGDGKCTAFSSAASSFLPSFMADRNGSVDVYRHCWKPKGGELFSVCFVDRISEPLLELKDLSQFYGYDAEEVRPERVDLCAGDPVNCATGNFFEMQVDLAIGGRGVGLDLVRTYNAQEAALASAPGPFGYGWSFSFGERLAIGAGGVSVHHADGQVARFTKRPDGSYAPERLVQSSLRRNPDGSYDYTLPDQRTFAFSAAGRLTAKSDRNANKTTLAYDAAGRPSSITAPSGRKLTLAYNAAGAVSEARDPAGRTVRYAYDAAKNLTRVTDVGAKTWEFAYDSKHRMTAFTNPRGAKTTNAYDARDRVTVQTDPLGRETKWAYDGDETKVTDPAGNVTAKRFRSHLPVWIQGAQGTSADAVTRLVYDAEANPVKVFDPNGGAWSYGYDGQGNRTRATDPVGQTTSSSYDPRRNLTALTLPSGRVTRFAYDVRSNPVSVQRTLTETGQTPTTTLAYDGLGQLTSATDPLGRSWRYAYNAQGDPTSATSPAGRKTTASYNAQGWLVSTVSGRGNATGSSPAAYTTTYTRDAYGRATAVRDPLGHSTTVAYDGAGNVTDATDRDGRRSRFAYDLADQPTEVTRGDASVLKSGFDANGRMISQTDGLGRTTAYGRDPLGRVTSTTDPLGRRTTYGYDRAGNRTSLRDPAGRTTSFGYDAADRLTSISYSSGAPKRISYGYDADGRLKSMTDGSGSSSMGYDSLGRLVGSTDGRGQALGYGYDVGDQLTSLTYPEQPPTGPGPPTWDRATRLEPDPPAARTVRRGYDPDGNLTSVTDWLGHTTSFGYDPDGSLQRTARPDASATTLTRDRNGVVTDLADVRAGTSVLRATTPRTAEGLLASTSESGAAAGPAESFRYDGAARLVAAGAGGASGYAYDAADNPTRLPSGPGALDQTFDAANQLTKIAKASGGQTVATLSYDIDGNRTQRTDANGARTSYGYDQADQLTSYTGPDRSRPGQTATARYSYDGTGLRTAKTVDGVERAQTWDRSGALPLLIQDGPTAYITGPDGRPIEQILPDGRVRYYHQDAHGSTRALTDQAGQVTARYAYDAYGNPTTPPAGVANPFGYDGQQTDPESGLQYLRARHYDPTTAQFLTRDPITDQTRAPYTYADDNPTNYHDPTGLAEVDVFGHDITPQLFDDGVGYAGDGVVGLYHAGEALDSTFNGYLDGLTGGATGALQQKIGLGGPECSDEFQSFGRGLSNLSPRGLFKLGRRGLGFAKKGDRGPSPGNLKRVGDGELKREVGDPHAFKEEILGTNKNLSAWDVHRSGSEYYLVNRKTGAIVSAD